METEISEQKKALCPKDFVLERILNNIIDKKITYLLGHLSYEDPVTGPKVLLKLEKIAFEEALIQQFNGAEHVTTSDHFFSNDIYIKFFLQLKPDFSKIQCDFIYPAPQNLIEKYTSQDRHQIEETAEIYEKYTKPLYIEKKSPSENEWMHNIIEYKKEIELTMFRNELFTLQLDFQYNHSDLNTLYLLAIPIQRDLRTIRDLTGEHLPLLKSIRNNSIETIVKKFGLPKSKILSLFHYQPTYYHLHIHFAHIDMAEQMGAAMGKGVALTDVIENLEMDSDYYKKKTMSIRLGTNHDLYKIFKENCIV
ncbi:hypothetical protein FGO68_gene3769 [Halteria grandinella]|uniref:M7GpppX diphosphatase n=1 Tax=Halteria grandinella TaxID=5974 RepID=A0A8J8NKT9_HALGN|nr:hypothetical protein FGO68_gene3769 [Halteria grandinella]